jgi:hypothetical protein
VVVVGRPEEALGLCNRAHENIARDCLVRLGAHSGIGYVRLVGHDLAHRHEHPNLLVDGGGAILHIPRQVCLASAIHPEHDPVEDLDRKVDESAQSFVEVAGDDGLPALRGEIVPEIVGRVHLHGLAQPPPHVWV